MEGFVQVLVSTESAGSMIRLRAARLSAEPEGNVTTGLLMSFKSCVTGMFQQG